MTDRGRVFLAGHVDIPEEYWTLVREALPEHVAQTLAEPGCIEWGALTRGFPRDYRISRA